MDGTLSPSTPVGQPTKAQGGAADLHALLSAAKEPGPYVLVAHSWGGLIARFYASTYPDEVAGLVLLDAASEFLQDELTPEQWDRFVQASMEVGEPKELEAVDYPNSLRVLPAAPPVVEIPLSCSAQISAGLLSLAMMLLRRRQRARRGWRLRISSLRFSTPSTSPIRTAPTSSKGSSPNS